MKSSLKEPISVTQDPICGMAVYTTTAPAGDKPDDKSGRGGG